MYETYVEEGTGTTQVRGADSGVSFQLPLVLGGLQLEKGADIGLPAVLIEGEGSGSRGELVVGERPGGGAVTVSNADLGGVLHAVLSLAFLGLVLLGVRVVHSLKQSELA